MRTFTIILIASLFCISKTYAQPGGERLESFKISFLTRNLDLSPEEAQQFWPVYNEYQDKVKALREDRRNKFYEKWKDGEDVSEKDYEASLDEYIDMRQREINLEEEYIGKFQNVLPNWKVAKLIVLEERFKLMILNELRNRKGENRPMRR